MAKHLGKTIRILREAKELTLGQLARESKVSVPFVSMVEKGTREPSLEVLRRIARAIGIPVEALIWASTEAAVRMPSIEAESMELGSTIQQLVDVEGKLRRLLQKMESSNAAKRRTPKRHRGRDENV